MTRGDGYDALYEEVGDRISKARATAGISQGKLATRVGVTRVSIVNLEHGRQRAPLHVLWRIATALGVEPARLVPSPRELAARDAPMELGAEVVASIERAARDDPAARRLLTNFIQKATTKIEGHDGTHEETAQPPARGASVSG